MDKALPASLEMERAVLAAAMKDRAALDNVLQNLNLEDFYYESHRQIFSCIRSLYRDNHVIDLGSVEEELRKNGHLDTVGGDSGLLELYRSIPTTAHVDYQIDEVRSRSLRRDLIMVCSDILSEVHDMSLPTQDVLGKAEQGIFRVAEQKSRQGFIPISDLTQPIYDKIERAKESGTGLTGLDTGFPDLNELTSGLQKSDLLILAARPGMGKTSLALSILRNMAVENKVVVGIFSLEMSAEQITERMLCSQARVNLKDVRSGKISVSTRQKLIRALGEISGAPAYIDATPNLNVQDVMARARRLKSERPELAMLVIDYLQLMSGSSSRSESRQQEVSEISRSLKGLARDLDIPVLALSQLSRDVEKRGGRPKLSDLRESGAIEQDADLVMFISQREEADGPEDPYHELDIAKHRNGPLGAVKLWFIREYTRFEQAAMEDEVSMPPLELDDAPF
jgi:replicative DNA helicase